MVATNFAFLGIETARLSASFTSVVTTSATVSPTRAFLRSTPCVTFAGIVVPERTDISAAAALIGNVGSESAESNNRAADDLTGDLLPTAKSRSAHGGNHSS